MYEGVEPVEHEPVWAAFGRRLSEASITLLTSAGFYIEGEQAPFDVERERREPTWGDPSYRVIPDRLDGRAFGMAHLHVNNKNVLSDTNVALPGDVLADLVAEGWVGRATPEHFSVMGFQGGLEAWRDETAPAIAERLRAQGTDGVVLAPV